MKKIIALLLAAMILMSLSATVFAEGDEREVPLEEAGITFHLPDAFCNTSGYTYPSAVNIDDGVCFAYIDYYAMSEDESRDLTLKTVLTAEDKEKLDSLLIIPFYVLRINDNRGFDEINGYFGGALKEENATVISQNEDETCFLYVDPDENERFAASLEEPYAGEFRAMLGALDELIESAEFYTPVVPFADLVGKQISFEGTDLEGSPVTSTDLFGKNSVTVLNFCASWIPERIQQLPELEALNSRLSEKNCSVVGILIDGNEAGAPEAEKQLIAESGVTYPVILPPDALNDILESIESVPITFFVDSDGKILTSPIVGVQTDRYEVMVDGLLSFMQR